MMVVRRKTWLNVRFKIDYNHKNEVIKKNFTSSHLFEKKKKRKKRNSRNIFTAPSNDDISPILMNTHRETSINIIRKHSFLNFLALAKRIRHIRFSQNFLSLFIILIFFNSHVDCAITDFLFF